MKLLITLLFLTMSVYSQTSEQLCSQLTGDGSGKDAKARTEFMKLTHSVSAKSEVARVKHEAVILKALSQSKSFELSTFLIQQLDICGGQASLPVLGNLLIHQELGPNAARTFTNLAKFNPSQARELLISAYQKQGLPYLINAMSVLKLHDSQAADIYRSALSAKDKKAFALQGLAQIGDPKDSVKFIGAFDKADSVFRGRAFRLNLVYTESLALKNKNAANTHLKSLKAILRKDEIPFITGIASVDFKINGVSDAWLDTLPNENIHTQIGILRLLKATHYPDVASRVEKRAKENPQASIYMGILAEVNSEKAAPLILAGLKSKDANIRATASKLALNYGDKFAVSLLKSLIKQQQAADEDVAMVKSMISKNNIRQVTKLWQGLNTDLTLAFIDITGNIQDSSVAAKMIESAKSEDKKVKKEALKTLKNVVSSANLNDLKAMLNSEISSSSVRYLQTATAASIALSDETVVKELFSSLYNERNDKLLVAFAKSNRPEVLPLLQKDLQNGSTDLQKETIKTLSAMSPNLSAKLLVTAVEKAKDDRNKILAARALAEAAANSAEKLKIRKGYLQQAINQGLPENEKKLLSDRLNKLK